MREHVNDPFVKKARLEGYRSRASYKLLEIDTRDHLLAPGLDVVDLGATPGGWSQVARQRMGKRGRVWALDLLPMQPLEGVQFLQGDFNNPKTQSLLHSALPLAGADLVLSDLAPNISGVTLRDQAQAAELWDGALNFAVNTLKPDGKFLVKVFHGADFEVFVQRMRTAFVVVGTRKPLASRDRSSEVYLLGKGLKPDAKRVWALPQEQDPAEPG